MGVLARGRVDFADVDGEWSVDWVFTDRTAGASVAPYDEANLGTHVGDDHQAVLANRARLAGELDVGPGALVTMEQVHGREVGVLTEVPEAGSPTIVADALITGIADLALVTQVADCVPVLLACPEGLVGVVHSGWRGVVAGVVEAAIDALVDRGAHADGIRAWIGPSICAECYEVGEQVREEVSAAAPAAFAHTRWGTAAVDVRGGVLEQLDRRGVHAQVIEGCTAEDDRLYSYRRDGRTGRQAGAIVMHRHTR